MEESKCHEEHQYIHKRIDALDKTQESFTREFREFRTDIQPVIQFFESAQIILKTGGWIKKAFWNFIVGIIVLLGAALTIKNLWPK